MATFSDPSPSPTSFPASSPSSSAPALPASALPRTSRGFATHTAESSPASARPFLEATSKQLGFLPAAVGRWAEAPALLQAFFHSLDLFEKTSLSFLEREAIVMTVARENGCNLCKALHTMRLLAGAPRETALALREGRPTGDARLDALTAFAREVLQLKGDVSPNAWQVFLVAGFSRAQALEVVLGVATTSLSTFANRLVEAPVDEPLAVAY